MYDFHGRKPRMAPYSPYTRNPPLLYICIGVLVVGIFLTILNVYELRRMQTEHFQSHGPMSIVEGQQEPLSIAKPVYWVYSRSGNTDGGYLSHIIAVFERIGFHKGDGESNWDVLWAHDYPFVKISKKMLKLLPHQKVNKFPGSGWITNKVELAKTVLTYIPQAFRIPEEKSKLMAHAKKFPEKMWVQKSSNHRGIEVLKLDALDLESEGTFIQEYISNPLLIDERKFDIGIYVVITSIDPLRIYIYNGDVLLRFCSKAYHPFNPKEVVRYVVGDDYTAVWQMPSLKHYYTELGYTFKESFNMYLTEQGKDPSKIWTQIDSSIIEVVTSKEQKLINSAAKYKSRDNFFELMRFDFMLDEDLNVYLMEANMSPNLSSAHFSANKLLYEQVVYNILSVVGIARRVHRETLELNYVDEYDMQVSDKDIQVFVELCASADCKDCSLLKCRACRKCLSIPDRMALKRAYLEHTNRNRCRRIYPPGVTLEESEVLENVKFPPNLSDSNRLMHLWYRGMCLKDKDFCS